MTKHRVKAEILSNSFGTRREKKKEDTIAESIGQQSNDLLLAISCKFSWTQRGGITLVSIHKPERPGNFGSLVVLVKCAMNHERSREI